MCHTFLWVLLGLTPLTLDTTSALRAGFFSAEAGSWSCSHARRPGSKCCQSWLRQWPQTTKGQSQLGSRVHVVASPRHCPEVRGKGMLTRHPQMAGGETGTASDNRITGTSAGYQVPRKPLIALPLGTATRQWKCYPAGPTQRPLRAVP